MSFLGEGSLRTVAVVVVGAELHHEVLVVPGAHSVQQLRLRPLALHGLRAARRLERGGKSFRAKPLHNIAPGVKKKTRTADIFEGLGQMKWPEGFVHRCFLGDPLGDFS